MPTSFYNESTAYCLTGRVLAAQVTSKRVTTAKSQEFVKASLRGGKKAPTFWQVWRLFPRASVCHGKGKRAASSARGIRSAWSTPGQHHCLPPFAAQNVRKQLRTHPLIIAFFFFVMIFSGESAAGDLLWHCLGNQATTCAVYACGHGPRPGAKHHAAGIFTFFMNLHSERRGFGGR